MADIGQLIGGYKIRSLLQTSIITQVFEVVEPTSGRHFAMKILLPEHANNPKHRKPLFAEAKVGIKLRHENVVNVIRVNESPTTPHFVMEYFPAGSIRKRLQSRKPEDKEFLKLHAKRIFKQACTGLAYMNASGFVHLDVKPDNILVNAMGQTKIIDFAISKPIKSGFLAKLFKKRGQPEGTASYMSPEQIRNQLCDGRADVYSMACAMFEILCKRPPFVGDTLSDLFRKHLFEKPSVPSAYNPDVTDEFGKLLVSMLAKKREDRPDGFHEVLMEMRKTRLFKSIPDTEEEQ